MHAAFAGQDIALLTQHGKERVIAPVLEPALGCRIRHITGFDTDQLGNFTGEIARAGTQLDAARRKARIGMERSGLPIAVASEGSFGPDPFTGLFQWNVELVLLIDERLGLEIAGVAQAAGGADQIETDSPDELEAFAARVGFPAQHLIVRTQPASGTQSSNRTQIHKGLADWNALRAAFEACLTASTDQKVCIETDLRAFANPTRMVRIRQATENLLARLQSSCPQCRTPGYWIVAHEPGLRCAACSLPTTNHLYEVWACNKCEYKTRTRRTDLQAADPASCARCNP